MRALATESSWQLISGIEVTSATAVSVTAAHAELSALSQQFQADLAVFTES